MSRSTVSQQVTATDPTGSPARTADPAPRWQPSAALVASAAAFFLGTGLDPVAILAWVAPLPVFLLAPRRPAGTVSIVTFAAALAGTANMWPYYLTARPIPIPVPVAVVIVLGTAGLFTATTLVLRGLLLRGRPALAAVAAPATWTGGLLLASLAAGGMDLSSATTQQTDLLPVLQIASLTGVWGVSFLVFLPAAAIAAACAPAAPRPARLRAAATGLVLLLAALGYGGVRLARLDDPAAAAPSVAALGRVQPDALDDQWEIDPATPAGRELLDSYAAAVRALPPDVRTVVLPEGVFSVAGPAGPVVVDRLTGVARARGTDVVVGAVDRIGDGRMWSTVALLVPADGDAPRRYVKHHDTGPHVQRGTGLTMAGRDGIAICMDLNYPELTRAYATAGATRMLLPASDTDVDGRWHARVAVARGVENGVSVAWGGNRGTSVIADAAGRILATADTAAPNRGAFAVATAALPDGPGSTPYTRLGDWFPWCCLVLAALGALGAVIPRVRER
ncbi:nitrilase-related carbon-nitrogen hydrolase [Pseudonocardia adelaidensis]|uniref:Apolipoprotein N-acyltransferase n=1 Tax=Pseudonocardia adelaidensis TaxID=648754 RepID=A0ABP9NE04_9PSEU